MTLISRLEAAESGSRELDIEITIFVFPKVVRRHANFYINDLRIEIQPYTTSLDAALTLVPEGWFVWGLSDHRTSVHYFGDKHEHVCWRASLQTIEGGRLTVASAKTLHLALCIAALKAKETSA